MDIREAQHKDLDVIFEMAENFARESSLKDKVGFDGGAFRAWIETWFANPNASIFLLDENKGFLAALLSPHFTNPSHVIAHEMAWWVKPEYRKGSGIALLSHFEKWAKEVGANSVIVSSIIEPETSRLDAFYKKQGYKVSEISYMKAI